jgi:tetrahydromethanopterin:alpha-L-glutamate ligase
VKIPIFTDEVAQSGGWHGTQLQMAFAAHNVEAVFVSLKDCVLDLSGIKPTIQIPHFTQLPKAAFVRGISGGTLQQITQRLNILHALKILGTVVYNDGRAIERTVDKAMTSFLLQQQGIATPKTWVCESRQQAHEIILQNQQLKQQLVIKPLFGSQGAGVRLVAEMLQQSAQHLPLPMDTHVDGVFYLQSFIKSSHDYRVFVVNNRAIAAMKRTGDTWLHNAALGAKCEENQENDVLEIALQAARVLDIGYCGVDVIRDESGKLFVLEVNSIPAWRGLQSVTETNISQVLVDDFLSKLKK